MAFLGMIQQLQNFSAALDAAIERCREQKEAAEEAAKEAQEAARDRLPPYFDNAGLFGGRFPGEVSDPAKPGVIFGGAGGGVQGTERKGGQPRGQKEPPGGGG